MPPSFFFTSFPKLNYLPTAPPSSQLFPFPLFFYFPNFNSIFRRGHLSEPSRSNWKDSKSERSLPVSIAEEFFLLSHPVWCNICKVEDSSHLPLRGRGRWSISIFKSNEENVTLKISSKNEIKLEAVRICIQRTTSFVRKFSNWSSTHTCWNGNRIINVKGGWNQNNVSAANFLYEGWFNGNAFNLSSWSSLRRRQTVKRSASVPSNCHVNRRLIQLSNLQTNQWYAIPQSKLEHSYLLEKYQQNV